MSAWDEYQRPAQIVRIRVFLVVEWKILQVSRGSRASLKEECLLEIIKRRSSERDDDNHYNINILRKFLQFPLTPSVSLMIIFWWLNHQALTIINRLPIQKTHQSQYWVVQRHFWRSMEVTWLEQSYLLLYLATLKIQCLLPLKFQIFQNLLSFCSVLFCSFLF